MANTTNTSNMNLILPIPGIETGPQYAIELNTAFTLVDSHTHIAGQGLPIPSAGLNIDADLTLNGFNLIGIRSTRFNSQASVLNLVTDKNILYVVNGELFYNDILGNNVQITLGGAVDTSSSGNITGMGATTASVVYTSINKTFTFYSNTNTPAVIKAGPVSISRNVLSPFFVTISGSVSQSSDYALTLPVALPVSQSLTTIDNTGVMDTLIPDTRTLTIISGMLSAYIPSGMISPFGGTVAPTSWLICDGSAVSRTTYSDLFTAIGSAYGDGNGTTTFNLPDCRGLFLRGVSGASGNDPDAASRTASGSGGNTGNNVGSFQSDELDSHTHIQDTHFHIAPRSDGSPFNPFGNSSTSINATNGGTTAVLPGTLTSSEVATNQNTGGNETRPKNLYVNYIIKV